MVGKTSKIKDFATKKLVDVSKPEEKVRQEYERQLFDNYGYAKGQMDIEVSIQRGAKGSKKNRDEKADIVVYKTTDEKERDQHKDILGIIETKRQGRVDGVKQLTSYMSATSCLWGVWTNGDEIEYLYRDKSTGEVKRDFVYQIPRNGETFEDIGKLKKENLKAARNLKPVFRRMLNTLYSNTNISRREKLGNELIRLIFCKIWDEKYNTTDLPQFRIGFKENPKEVKKRVNALFADVKKELVADGVFDKNEEIKLDDKSVAYVVGELEPFGLLRTEKDIIGDAFEVFAESKLVGEKGEFFTPREVVKTAVQIIAPKPEEKILDPACGSGGFLIYSLEEVWREMDTNRKWKGTPDLVGEKRKIAERNFFGVDKESDLVKIAKAYMAIIGDGRGGIIQENTLHRFEDYNAKAKELFVDDNNKPKQVDIILTNPPFGRSARVLKDDSKYFDLGYAWKKQNGRFVKTNRAEERDPYILFIERCLEMLKEGGRMAIVLPETPFHAPNTGYVLQYILSGNNITHILDLPHNTFRPHNNAKTILVVLEKGVQQGEEIVMGVAEQVGHDHNGKPLYRYDKDTNKFTEELWDDTEIIRKELKSPSDKNNKYVFTVKFSDIQNNLFVPRYYWEKSIESIKQKGIKLVTVDQLIQEGVIETFSGHGSPRGEFKGLGNIPYVRVADIVNWEIYKNPTSLIPQNEYERVKGKGVDLQKGDLLFVRRGSYRIGSVALVSELDRKVLLTREIQVFRVKDKNNKYGIDPHYLIYLFSNQVTQKQIPHKVMIDTTLPNMAERWRGLYLPIHTDQEEKRKCKNRMRKIFDGKWDAKEAIEDISGQYGDLTT